MTTNQSVQLFVRLVQEKDSELKAAANTLLRDLAGDDPATKKSSAEKALRVATDLRTILSRSDVPGWLNDTINYISQFTAGNWRAKDFITNFVNIKAQLDLHRWQFDHVAEAAFDFDSIFEHYKKGSRLPELFDEIIRLLEEIEASGEVDSVSMLRALAKVIATIRKCKDGSYFSLNSAWEFLLSFLNNYMWGELSKLPVLGTALEALSKTIKEADEEMFKVHKAVQDEMVRTVTAEVKALSNKSAFPFVEYNRSGHLLPTSNPRQLPDLTV
ncbi:hypothetical protein [Vogesella alkaliphila]|uniref:Uncharacterized protein n=1 Tax=Vogesella alkaliphila TaxID=1193621 RepID=A0ABQ2YH62_9NEIS|nr:hypothetical protein [Vogesella alkaliphila]GGX82007.1 hypothetical protein GCM10011290_06770 [Vogesella alkaliphila]